MTKLDMRRLALSLFALLLLASGRSLQADPCGMVPPVRIDPDDPAITRVGAQKTWVFYKDGVCDIAIRPGFSGKVSEFGMLIPFPAVPALRKVPDDLFTHIEKAIDPPEVVVWVRRYLRRRAGAMPKSSRAEADGEGGLKVNEVRVVKQEAVGMYEVAVLEAGSARALNRWMDDHGYTYPTGMDAACEDYVHMGWCFVAVKTRVAPKRQVDPKPGMEKPSPELPEGASFDGNVQAMGFRFKTDELIVPMRLSAFNAGKLHNIVYCLTEKPMKIEQLPETMVTRTMDGETLYRNVTGLLPLVVKGGTIDDLSPRRLARVQKRRDPNPHNGHAKQLFAGDLLAARTGRLSHPHEEAQKQLLSVGEALGLWGEAIDALNRKALEEQRREIIRSALDDLKEMTLTVIDGDFPRELIRKENLLFSPLPVEETEEASSEGAEQTGTDSSGTSESAETSDSSEETDQAPAEPEASEAPSEPDGGGIILFVVFGLFLLVLVGGLLLRSGGGESGRSRLLLLVVLVCLFGFGGSLALADPCGMVPPVQVDPDDPAITRVGAQKTWVFYKNGVCDIAIRPGFSGKVSEFGMLIPFPAVPALRKVPDKLFAHIGKAIDPPEIVVDLRPREYERMYSGGAVDSAADGGEAPLRVNEVRVLKQEAVGMYEVAVLEAGSARALNRWMDDHGYKYPTGMDAACEDYVHMGWCFVAVKTRVAPKKQVDPKPGMEKPTPELPDGASFDGNVQAMGFRFKTDELVVPMRLSAFNAGKLHNIVYCLTDKPMKVEQLPQDMIKRTMDGKTLYRNVTGLLPLKVLGGTIDDISAEHMARLRPRRNPEPHNGHAKQLFAGDLLAARTGRLSHPHEEAQKQLLAVGEALGLRGDAIDQLNRKALEKARREVVQEALEDLKGMTLTVIDGDFPRELIRKENLLFSPLPAEFRETEEGTTVEERTEASGEETAGASDPTSETEEGAEADGGGLILFVVFGVFLVLLIGGLLLRSDGGESGRGRSFLVGLLFAALLSVGTLGFADPCGMVPPVRIDTDDPALTRIDVQKTWVFHKNGIEDFVVRPAFSGKVEEFGMLIPCPEPPALRKVSDDIFTHVKQAVDPPVVKIRTIVQEGAVQRKGGAPGGADRLGVNEVKVLREEAVGMYEVAVLEAGSAKALERWMDDHGYIYPDGMDEACNDYVKDGWCFVAVKTRVAPKKQVDPKPGMESPDPKLPKGATFDGAVQAMGFRFRTEKIVVPMRLSAFNAGKLDNKVWILTEKGVRFDQLPKEMVKRQISGETLYKNVTEPLPYESEVDIEKLMENDFWKRRIPRMRDPEPKNGQAKRLFAGDLLAAREDRLAHPHEEREKRLLAIGEALGLRGEELDAAHEKALAEEIEAVETEALTDLKGMTLTIIEGEFPRDVLAAENLTTVAYELKK